MYFMQVGMASDDGELYISFSWCRHILARGYGILGNVSEDRGRQATSATFFDNCYAGTTRSEERLLAQRPLPKVQSPVFDNYLVFTAGESNRSPSSR